MLATLNKEEDLEEIDQKDDGYIELVLRVLARMCDGQHQGLQVMACMRDDQHQMLKIIAYMYDCQHQSL